MGMMERRGGNGVSKDAVASIKRDQDAKRNMKADQAAFNARQRQLLIQKAGIAVSGSASKTSSKGTGKGTGKGKGKTDTGKIEDPCKRVPWNERKHGEVQHKTDKKQDDLASEVSTA